MDQSTILVINCGSSSIKFSLVDVDRRRHIISGIAERLNSDQGLLRWSHNGDDDRRRLGETEHQGAMEAVIDVLRDAVDLEASLIGIGHRVVHGAEAFQSSTIIDDKVLAAVEACNHLAPLHNPANVLGIRTAQRLFPDLPQVAVFDTAFHQDLPPHAYLYPIPYKYYTEAGVRRYGFHGTSHRYVSREAARRLDRPVNQSHLITAHLGNGCSATAVRDGKSVDTTMGLTPLEGLMMGTRSGDVDPSLHQYLARERDLSLDEITHILNKESGLLGLSGVSNDMRAVLAAADDGQSRAQYAVDVFCYRLAKSIAALAVPLGRIDALVFTGGIGEHAAPIRARVLDQLGLLGFELDPHSNANHGREQQGIITTPTSTIAMVVPTDEEMMIAADTLSLVRE